MLLHFTTGLRTLEQKEHSSSASTNVVPACGKEAHTELEVSTAQFCY